MKLISIDVGIKNCSFCVLTTNNPMDATIPNPIDGMILNHWVIVNLTDLKLNSFSSFLQKSPPPCIKCSCLNANKKKCSKNATYKKGNENGNENGNEKDNTKETHYYCNTHAAKDVYFLADDLIPSFLKKQPLKVLQELLNKYKINFNQSETNNEQSETNNEKKYKKVDLLNLLVDHYNVHGLFLIQPKIKKIKSTECPLQVIGKNIIAYFDSLNLCDLDRVIIENQIGPLATKMKTVQGMLMQYFLMRNNLATIEFISATNKLKDYDNNNNANDENALKKSTNNKKEYNKRKNKSIYVCLDFLKTTESLYSWKSYYQSCKKKDDLSDCFLQAIWYITHLHI